MERKLSPQEKHEARTQRGNPSVRVAQGVREVTVKTLVPMDKMQKAFLKKYSSGTLMEAVQMDGYAANEFIDTLLRTGAFGNASKIVIQDALLKAVESHDAADTFIKNPMQFRKIVYPSAMRDALMVVIFKHTDLAYYFKVNYGHLFSYLPGADEVLEQLDRKATHSH